MRSKRQSNMFTQNEYNGYISKQEVKRNLKAKRAYIRQNLRSLRYR